MGDEFNGIRTRVADIPYGCMGGHGGPSVRPDEGSSTPPEWFPERWQLPLGEREDVTPQPGELVARCNGEPCPPEQHECYGRYFRCARCEQLTCWCAGHGPDEIDPEGAWCDACWVEECDRRGVSF